MIKALLVRSRLIDRRKVSGALVMVTLVLAMQVGVAPIPRAQLGQTSELDRAPSAGSGCALTLGPDRWWWHQLPYLPLSTVNWD